MIGKRHTAWLVFGALLLLLALLFLLRSDRREMKPEAPPSSSPVGGASPVGPRKSEPAVDVVRAVGEVREKLARIRGIEEKDRRLAELILLVRAYKELAAPALPLVTPFLADSAPQAGMPAGEKATPRREALAMLGAIGSEEAVEALIGVLQEEVRLGNPGGLPAVLRALGETRRHRAAIELCRLLEQFQDTPGEVRDRLVDFFMTFPLREWPAPTACAIVENTRTIWETLVLDPDPFGPSFAARELLDEQVETLIDMLGRPAEEQAMALDLLRRIGNRYLPAEPGAWREWFAKNRQG